MVPCQAQSVTLAINEFWLQFVIIMSLFVRIMSVIVIIITPVAGYILASLDNKVNTDHNVTGVRYLKIKLSGNLRNQKTKIPIFGKVLIKCGAAVRTVTNNPVSTGQALRLAL